MGRINESLIKNSFVALQLPYSWANGTKSSFSSGSAGILTYQACQNKEWGKDKKCAVIVTAAHILKNGILKDIKILPHSGFLSSSKYRMWQKALPLSIITDLDLASIEIPLEHLFKFKNIQPIISGETTFKQRQSMEEYAEDYLIGCTRIDTTSGQDNWLANVYSVTIGYAYIHKDNQLFSRVFYPGEKEINRASFSLQALQDKHLNFLYILPYAQGIVKTPYFFSQPGISGSVTWGCKGGKTVPHSMVLRGDSSAQHVWSIRWKTILKHYIELTNGYDDSSIEKPWKAYYQLDDKTGNWKTSYQSNGWRLSSRQPKSLVTGGQSPGPEGTATGDGGGEGGATEGGVGQLCSKNRGRSIPSSDRMLNGDKTKAAPAVLLPEHFFTKIPSPILSGVIIENQGQEYQALQTGDSREIVYGIGDLYRRLLGSKVDYLGVQQLSRTDELLYRFQKEFLTNIDLELEPVGMPKKEMSFFENFKNGFNLDKNINVRYALTYRRAGSLPLVFHGHKDLRVVMHDKGSKVGVYIYFGDRSSLKFLHNEGQKIEGILQSEGVPAELLYDDISYLPMSKSKKLLEEVHSSTVQLLLHDPNDQCDTWIQILDLGRHWKIDIANLFSYKNSGSKSIEQNRESLQFQIVYSTLIDKPIAGDPLKVEDNK